MQSSVKVGKVCINLGCGSKNLGNFINVDLHQPCDVVVDLENLPLPFDDNSVDVINASQIMEHIRNFIPLMNDIHRILKRGGELMIDVPLYPYRESVQDPTHVRFFTEDTFKYFLEGDFFYEECGKGYGILPFSKMEKRQEGFILYVRFTK